jgi:hypothetical protein
MKLTRVLACAAVVAMLAVAAPSAAPAGGAAARIEFGVGGFGAIRDYPIKAVRLAAYQDLRDLGVRWIRTDISWDKVELEPGVYEWARLDRLVNETKAAGLKVLAVFHRTADFARPAAKPEWTPPTAPIPLNLYAKFARTLALRYTKPGQVRIQAVEVWNEANNPKTWDGSMTSIAPYVALLSRSWTEFKKVNPATKIITSGLAPAEDTSTSVNPRTWLKRLYAAGARKWFDAVGMHPYTFPALASAKLHTGWGNMVFADRGRPSMRQTMAANGDGAKKIWATEFGSPASLVGEPRQAKIASDGVKVWGTYSWAGPFFYQGYRDQSELPGWHKSMGLTRDDGTRRPAFAAYRTALRAIH